MAQATGCLVGRQMKATPAAFLLGLALAGAGCNRLIFAHSSNKGDNPPKPSITSTTSAIQPRDGLQPPPGGTGASDFQIRCQTPGVIRCFGFDSPGEVQPHLFPAWDKTYRGQVVTDLKASGAGSLRFEIPSHSAANTSGSFWLNFSDDLRTQFGSGDEFFIQWRQRFSPELLHTEYKEGEGWKQIIIGEGDRPGFTAGSCTPLEIVVQNSQQRGFPQMYHSCGEKDGNYEPLDYWDHAVGNIVLQNAVGCSYAHPTVPPCVGYKANQWMTFQVRIKIGTWYKNDGRYRRDSTIQLWVGEEGRRSKMVIDFSPEHRHGYDIANTDPVAKYGKLWLLPYHTNKDDKQSHPVGYTWYDELIISRTKIPDPKQ